MKWRCSWKSNESESFVAQSCSSDAEENQLALFLRVARLVVIGKLRIYNLCELVAGMHLVVKLET